MRRSMNLLLQLQEKGCQQIELHVLLTCVRQNSEKYFFRFY
jgi:hypothetical protein